LDFFYLNIRWKNGVSMPARFHGHRFDISG
jgi:hypothetical protein